VPLCCAMLCCASGGAARPSGRVVWACMEGARAFPQGGGPAPPQAAASQACPCSPTLPARLPTCPVCPPACLLSPQPFRVHPRRERPISALYPLRGFRSGHRPLHLPHRRRHPREQRVCEDPVRWVCWGAAAQQVQAGRGRKRGRGRFLIRAGMFGVPCLRLDCPVACHSLPLHG